MKREMMRRNTETIGIVSSEGIATFFTLEAFVLECADLFHKSPEIADAVFGTAMARCAIECSKPARACKHGHEPGDCLECHPPGWNKKSPAGSDASRASH